MSAERDKSSSSSVAVWVGTIATVLALLATIYIGVRENREKVLEIRFVATLSLLNEASVADGLEVRFRDAAVGNVSKFLFIARNAGDIPIVPSDVEQPLTLSFSDGRVLEARITETAPAGIDADATMANSSAVRIRHGLLNPGDAVSFEILTDGEAWPTVAFRISGVSGPRTVMPEQAASASRVTWSPLSEGQQGIILAVASIALIVVFFFFYIDVTDDFALERYEFDADRESKALADIAESQKAPMVRLREAAPNKVPAVFATLVWEALGPYKARSLGSAAARRLTFEPTKETLEQFVERGKQEVLSALSQPRPPLWTTAEVRKLVYLIIGTVAVIDVIAGAWRAWG